MARHIRHDADPGVTTLDEVRAPERVPADVDIDRFDRSEPVLRTDVARVDGEARERFGGMNLGACFFGWLVAIASAVLLTTMMGAMLAAVGFTVDVAQSDTERQAGTIGIAAGVLLLVVLLVGYYAGGYVAGRMSRFDGGRQGFGVWAIGLVGSLLAGGLGAIFGTQYDLLDRVDLPRMPLSSEQMGWGAAVAVAIVLGTLLAAILGGLVGRRYHDRVDRAVRGRPSQDRDPW
jgi:hypothetical protein